MGSYSNIIGLYRFGVIWVIMACYRVTWGYIGFYSFRV